jgi:hypothetical protein
MGSSPIQAFQVRGWLTEVLIDHDMLKTTYQGDLFFFDFGSGAKALRVLYLFFKRLRVLDLYDFIGRPISISCLDCNPNHTS